LASAAAAAKGCANVGERGNEKLLAQAHRCALLLSERSFAVLYRDYVDALLAHRGAASVETYGEVFEDGATYPLFRMTVEGPRSLLITSGFHGEEPAGPLTLATHFAEIAAHARRAGVGLRVYPCINPSGFEHHQRYNRSGEKPNNDFLRYETTPGVLKGELGPSESFLRWSFFHGGPKETRALKEDLARWPVPQAALDIHQDDYLPEPMTYAYTFGERAPYIAMMKQAAPLATIARSFPVDEQLRSDGEGLIAFHDGSITDYYWRRGVRYVATLETTTVTPMERCHAINLVWIKGFIELAARAEVHAQPHTTRATIADTPD
jgi:hypothetical protein